MPTMKQIFATLWLLAPVLALSQPAPAGKLAPFTYSDLLLIDRLSGLAVDPAGMKALFNVRATDMEKNRGVSSLWMKDLSDPAKPEWRLPVSDGGASDVQWASDGSGFYFLSARGEAGTTQVWKADAAGAKAEQVTRLALDVKAYRVAPGGKGLVVALEVFPDCPGDEIACTLERLEARKGEKSTGQLHERLFLRHWDTWEDGLRNHLFYVDAGSPLSPPVPLTRNMDGDCPSKPFGGNEDFCISADGRTVFFTMRIAGMREPWSTNFDLYSVPVSGGTPVNLTMGNPAWDAMPVVSPDGKTLAYKAMRRPGYESDRFEMRLRDLATGAERALAMEWDRSVAGMKWSRDGKSLLVTADDMGRHRLFRVDIKAGKVLPLSREGHMDDFAETPKGFVFLRSGLSGPAQLFSSKPKANYVDADATLLTAFNAGLKEKAFGAYEQFSFKGWNDETVHGYVVKPANYEEGKKYPVAFLIHGGPQGSFGDAWSYRWNAQTYAGQGFAVVMIDFHGSTGYGQAFTDAIRGHWGDRPLEDLRKGWDHALRKYPFLDADRAAALGASYGGFMVNWIAGVWQEPWKALVSHCGIFDTRAMGYSTEELWFTDWENGASVFRSPKAYEEFNPLLHADNWSVPMLVIHGDKDYRVPLTQGIGSFTACQAKGIESRYLRFPDENHWVLKPQNSRLWHETVMGWLERHIGGRR
ncbi:MAG: prolyl oligopeptidase family serine peptidase [Flavobacteriales bacterium]